MTAPQLLAAGYRKPAQVTSAEDLDALPAGAVIEDCRGIARRKLAGTWWGYIDSDVSATTGTILARDGYGPFTVLHVSEGGE